MRRANTSFLKTVAAVAFAAVALAASPHAARAVSATNAVQGEQPQDNTRERAFALCAASRYEEALPLLELLYAANQNDVAVVERLAFAVLSHSLTVADPAKRKETRARARSLADKAKALGSSNQLALLTADAIPPDGAEVPYSDRAEVDAAVREGEAAFAQNKFDDAIAAYTRALALDPKMYEAALFIGDCYYVRKQLDPAVEWFARAASIDRDRETAHRYWGDALLDAGKADEAREHYLDGIIAEPYRRETWFGMLRWAQATGHTLAHPRIEPQMVVTKTDDETTNLTLSASALADASAHFWLFYGISRASWAKEKFAKTFPKEKTYRHSLPEEAESLEIVAKMVNEEIKNGRTKPEKLDVSLANLVKLDAAGLVEPFVLFALVDEGIAADYEPYRSAHRAELKRYLADFVIGEKK